MGVHLVGMHLVGMHNPVCAKAAPPRPVQPVSVTGMHLIGVDLTGMYLIGVDEVCIL
jgi:hypothetical protein